MDNKNKKEIEKNSEKNENSEEYNAHTTVIKGSRMNDMPSDDLPF